MKNIDEGYGQITNAEIYAVLSLVLMEMQKINKHFHELLQNGEKVTPKSYLTPPFINT